MSRTKKKTEKKAEELNAKQKKFCEEYVIDMNGTQAAIRAGYSEKTADVRASQLLGILKVKEYVEELKAKIAKKNEITVDWVVNQAKEIIQKCKQDVPVLNSQGKPTGVYKFDSNGANGALKILARYLGMENKKIELTGKNGGPIQTAVVVSPEEIKAIDEALDEEY